MVKIEKNENIIAELPQNFASVTLNWTRGDGHVNLLATISGKTLVSFVAEMRRLLCYSSLFCLERLEGIFKI